MAGSKVSAAAVAAVMAQSTRVVMTSLTVVVICPTPLG